MMVYSPSANDPQHPKPTTNLQQVQDVRGFSCRGGMRDGEVGGADEGEEHDQAEEGQGEEDVDAERAD